MSRILKFDPSYDLWLTYSVPVNNNHGVCGHIFEVFDYYYLLKDHFKVGIFFGEDIDWTTVEDVIRKKYTFTDEEIATIKQHTVFHNRPGVIQGKNILFTDGGVVNNERITLLFDNIFYFACSNQAEIKVNKKKNVYILQDDRVYEPVDVNGINYKKRILFSKMHPATRSDDNVLIYATKNCRNIFDYEELKKYGKLLVITHKENRPPDQEGITFEIAPADDLFNRFSKYVYTPVDRKWDCSSRFLAECKYYGKEILFHGIDYWGIDHGLFWRWYDIQNDFDSLVLKEDDEIISILKKIIC